jgi:short-subunit dehydrogenase
MNFNERPHNIWITGASTGIGRALSLQLAQQGHRIIASARNEDALTQLHQEYPDNIDALPLDINDAQAQQEAGHWIEQTYGYLDTLIHAAGICEYVDTQAFDTELIERVFNTNVIGTVKSLNTALPLLRKNPSNTHFRPYILVISSCVAWLPLPRAEAYGASKAAITHFCESLKADLYHEGIDVSVISPGFVKTPMTDANDFKMPMLISAETAANNIIKQMHTRPWDIHFPKGFTWPLWLLSHLPAALRQRITRRLSRKQKTPHNKVTTAP